jgi:ERF superfamily
MSNAAKDSSNPFFHSKYADLASIRDACMEDLNKNGIGVMQFPRQSEVDGNVFVEVETLLMHESGEWFGDSLVLPVTPKYDKDTKAEYVDAQAIGSAITYARRYALASMCGVAPEEDDGNGASAKGHNVAPRKNAAADLRQKALAILEPASKQGTEAYKLAWESLSTEMRKAVLDDHNKILKPQAIEADKRSAPVNEEADVATD